ncbi:MAG: glycosyltransferase [Cyanophyceae cyanobacterium]
MNILTAVTVLSLTIWGYLLGFRGQFWRANQRLEEDTTPLQSAPSLCVIVPARNEAELLPVTLRSLLTQDYPALSVVLVDDGSTDGTAQVAQEVANSLQSQRLTVIAAKPLPPGWTGKLWAMHQGIDYAQQSFSPNYFLLTDADIEHHSENVLELVTKAETEDLDLVSLMVLLRCQSVWEKLLIPAFVFFFQKLYPFPLVNQPHSKIAAAAGGCILIRRQALKSIGGIPAVRQALIDDCALAQAVKSSPTRGKIWLGLTQSTRSLRPYPTLNTIWEMVARTAFTQLHYSPLLLVGTLLGMTLVYLVPPIVLVWGIITGTGVIAVAGLIAWLLMAIAYTPTLRLYQISPLWAVSLPVIAFLYTLMTLDSARCHWQGQGGAWKGRVYSGKA